MDMPAIISVLHLAGSGRASLRLAIAADLDVFEGHFTGTPVVPGVVQIHWALQLACEYLQPLSPLRLAQLEAVKFQQLMMPDNDVLLELELTDDKLVFAFSSATRRYSSGRIVINP